MTETATYSSSREDYEKVYDLIKDINIAMMVTQSSDGQLYARPMAVQKPDADGTLWFMTSVSSPKINEIATNPSVLLSYAEPAKNNYVSITGEAEVVKDRAKIGELWSEMMTTWWPKGKKDPDICLIRVEPQSAEYWDSPSNTFVIGFGYAKAKLTGEAETFGDNKIVRL